MLRQCFSRQQEKHCRSLEEQPFYICRQRRTM